MTSQGQHQHTDVDPVDLGSEQDLDDNADHLNESIPTATSKAGQIFGSSNINDLNSEQVNHPIAALVIGMDLQGVRYGLASDNMQQLARLDPDHGLPCLKSPTEMILPILLADEGDLASCGEELADGTVIAASAVKSKTPNDKAESTPSEKIKKDKDEWKHGAIGHWLTVIATRQRRTVDLKSMNSAPQLVQQAKVRAVARNCP